MDTKRVIKELLEWTALSQTGMRKLNGGYAKISYLKIKEQSDGYDTAGLLTYGIVDTGDGCSEQYKEEFEKTITKTQVKQWVTKAQ